MKRLAREGWDVTVVPCDESGQVSAESVAEAITDRTVLVSVMAANNEVGTLNPIGEIGRLCHERGILFHTDATQAVGKVPLDVLADEIDLLSLSATQDSTAPRGSVRCTSGGATPRCGSSPSGRRRTRARAPERDDRRAPGRRAGRRPPSWRSASGPRRPRRVFELRERLHAGHRRAGRRDPAQRPSDASGCPGT